MSKFSEFERILSDFNRIEERVFIKKISDFAESGKDVVIHAFGLLLKQKQVNIQLKYLVLKTMGELKYREFVPMINGLLKWEDKVRIVYEAVDGLVSINTLESYKSIVRFMRENQGADFIPQVENSLAEMFDRNKLIYHFDVFYRQRGEARGIDKSSLFLAKYLEDGHIKELLPALTGRYYTIRFELLALLKERPNPMFYSAVYNFFKTNGSEVDDRLFLLLSEALVANARLSKLVGKIYPALKHHLSELTGTKQRILGITLLKLNTPDMIPLVTAFYPHLKPPGKLLVFDNLNREDYPCFLDFLRLQLQEAQDDALLKKVIEIMIFAKDFEYMFQLLGTQRMQRREKLLNILMDFDPPDIQGYVKDYIHASQSVRVLSLAMEYLLRHAADEYFDLIKSVFFSGVSPEIKTLIIRHVNRFSGFNRKNFMETVFKDVKMISQFKKDFLFSMLGVLNEKTFERSFEQLILGRILILMEESRIDEVVNFIYFFDNYEIHDDNDRALIIEELRLIQNTILKSSNKGDLVRMIHVLIKNIEKKARMKAYADKEEARQQKLRKGDTIKKKGSKP